LGKEKETEEREDRRGKLPMKEKPVCGPRRSPSHLIAPHSEPEAAVKTNLEARGRRPIEWEGGVDLGAMKPEFDLTDPE